MHVKTESGQLVCKEISSCEDIDDEVVGHPDDIYNDTNQQHRIQWLISELKKNRIKGSVAEIGTACAYILNKIDGNIGIDIRSDRLMVAKRKYPNKKFYYGNIFNMEPFYNMGIKALIAAEIFEHLPYDSVHHAIIQCLKSASIVYYTVPNSETDDSVAKNQEHRWYPTRHNLTTIFSRTMKLIDMTYEIKSSNNFLYGTIKRT